MAILVATVTGLLLSPCPLENKSQVTIYCGVLFLLSWAALVVNYRFYIPPKWTKPTSPVGKDDHEQSGALGKQGTSDTRRIDVRLMVMGGALFFLIGLILGWIFQHFLTAPLTRGNEVFSFWRSVNPFTGVSPLVPLVLLSVGLYGWFWQSLSGLALFNAGRPKLPRLRDLPPHMPMFSRGIAGRWIERSAIPLNGNYILHFALILLPCWIFWWVSGDVTAVRTLGQRSFGKFYLVWAGLLIVLTLTESWQMLRTWARLRQLLLHLDRLPLRRTLQALKGYSWGTVWKMSGNVIERRDLLISRQIESLRHLENEVALYREAHPKTAAEALDGEVDKKISPCPVISLGDQIKACNGARDTFRDWFTNDYHYRWPRYQAQGEPSTGELPAGSTQSHGQSSPADLSAVFDFQEALAATAGVVMKRILLPQWRRETKSQILDLSTEKADGEENEPTHDTQSKRGQTHPTAVLEPHLRAAEEFFCLPYLGFIQSILGRIRTMTLSITFLFVAAALSAASYPFDPRPVLGGTFLVVFLVTSVVTIFVYAEMHRDPTLSHITNTNPGKLGMDFWFKLVTFGFGPLLALLTALFPQITGFVTGWLQPTVGAIK